MTSFKIKGRFNYIYTKHYKTMKIKFTKDHLEHSAGDEIETTDEQGAYLVAMQTAEEVIEDDATKRGRKPKDK